MRLSRRQILARLGFGVTLVAGIAAAPRSLLSQLFFEPDAPLVPPQTLPINLYTKQGRSIVAMVQGTDVSVMLSEGLRLLEAPSGGVSWRGKRILIKPNVLNNRPPPTTTNPAVVEAVVRASFDAGASDVSVADGSGMIRLPTRDNLIRTGIAAAAERAGATTLALEEQGWVRVEPPQTSVMRRFLVSRPVYEADILINVPVLKTHRFSGYSCALKNLVGIVHPRHRPSLAFLSGSWHERIAELNVAVHPHLNIVDATSIMIAGGPTSGRAAEGRLLLLSGDRVALDAVAVALLRTYRAWPAVTEKPVWEQRQITRAGELGLGATGPHEMEIVGTSLDTDQAAFGRLVAAIRQDVGVAEA